MPSSNHEHSPSSSFAPAILHRFQFIYKLVLWYWLCEQWSIYANLGRRRRVEPCYSSLRQWHLLGRRWCSDWKSLSFWQQCLHRVRIRRSILILTGFRVGTRQWILQTWSPQHLINLVQLTTHWSLTLYKNSKFCFRYSFLARNTSFDIISVPIGAKMASLVIDVRKLSSRADITYSSRRCSLNIGGLYGRWAWWIFLGYKIAKS